MQFHFPQAKALVGNKQRRVLLILSLSIRSRADNKHDDWEHGANGVDFDPP
jgi:hypothetical protein